MVYLARVRRNPLSAGLFLVCLWLEHVFLQDYTHEMSRAGSVLQILGAPRSLVGHFIASLGPVLPVVLVAFALFLGYKEYSMLDEKKKLKINAVSCVVFLILPLLLFAEVNGEIQAVVQQLGR